MTFPAVPAFYEQAVRQKRSRAPDSDPGVRRNDPRALQNDRFTGGARMEAQAHADAWLAADWALAGSVVFRGRRTYVDGMVE